MGTVHPLRVDGKSVFDRRSAALAARSFKKREQHLAMIMASETDASGVLTITSSELARITGFERSAVLRGIRALEASGMITRPRSSGGRADCTFVWHSERTAQLAAEAAARIGERTRASDGNECSLHQDVLDVWAAAYSCVHFSDERFLRPGRPPRVTLKTKNPQALANFADHTERAGCEFGLELQEIAEQYARAFHRSKDEAVKRAGFSFDFFAFELDNLEREVWKTLAKRRDPPKEKPKETRADVASVDDVRRHMEELRRRGVA